MRYNLWPKHPHGSLETKRLEAFKTELGCCLPEQFRHWLKEINGGKPENACISVSEDFGFACVRHMYGFHGGPDYCQLDNVNHILEGNLNAGLVAFGDDAGGNQFTISVRPKDLGTVKLWDHETTAEYGLAENFQCFLTCLRNVVEFVPKVQLIEILENDDVPSLKGWLIGKDIDAKDQYNRAPIENAALNHSVNCIKFLHSKGAKPFDSVLWLKRHLKHNPRSQNIIDLIQELYPSDNGHHQQR